ncbi:gamma-butyrobetaine hydroxylase-like domain-containing protein [Pseudomonas sp. KFB-139]|uniref:Gamma-butyrobetaine hydroxylase-like domain-containing protein n=1 Tax=Pseudomonas serbiensis TaxID=3064350 RepID=A0ABT9CTA5_9PSED|nr:gamma-butyrobetaine hydroxylase-like domain-containing protein [Pseudomonas sp. KFB-138]MDO7928053.1 gamma-butyrobetaine hydroxylase-like domain-containing protein [Pseudomonas sp. KFB-138]
MMVPSAIRNVRHGGLLHVEWPDGQAQALAHGQLRALCPCSHCRAARLRGRIDLVNEEVRITDIVDQGYGVQLIFSDGHMQGIYPWAYIRAMITL